MDNSTQIQLGDMVDIRTNYSSYAGQLTYLPCQPGDCVIICDRYNGQIIQTYGDFTIILTSKKVEKSLDLRSVPV